jgi:hypothetical protein
VIITRESKMMMKMMTRMTRNRKMNVKSIAYMYDVLF